jgi:hypothetical protein
MDIPADKTALTGESLSTMLGRHRSQRVRRRELCRARRGLSRASGRELAQVFDPCLEVANDRLKVAAIGASFAGRDAGLAVGENGHPPNSPS